MAKYVDVNTDYDCAKNGHFDAVSACCGGRPHEWVDGMCGSCNEVSGWVCSVCDADMNTEVFHMELNYVGYPVYEINSEENMR